MEDAVRRAALANRARHGKANPKSVLGAVLGENPELKGDMGELRECIQRVVREVNALPDSEVGGAEAAGSPAPAKDKPELALPGDPSGVVMRFAPNPNGAPTLGNARGIVVNSELAKKHSGKLILRFDDTDPRTKPPLAEAYDWYVEDLKWLGAEPAEVVAASERMEKYYEAAGELVGKGAAYVCSCTGEGFKKLKDAGEACPHRERGVEENQKLWSEMLSGSMEEGSGVLRIKTDLSNPDPALRDWVAFRIIKTPHPRTSDKYCVWPTLDFEGGVEDHLLGVTHILRGKDLADAEKRQKFFYDALGWTYPEVLHWGRISVTDEKGEVLKLSTSGIAEGVRSGEYSGWSDVRLPTLRALARRGVTAEAVRNTMLDLGLSLNDVSVSLETLYAENRKILDASADRFFFVEDPVPATLSCPPAKTVRLPLHPSHPERGLRECSLEHEGEGLEIQIAKSDAADLKVGDKLKLIGLPFVEVKSASGGLALECIEGKHSAKKIQWLCNGLDAEILLPDKPPSEPACGLCEPACGGLEVGGVVQFERVGFCRLDAKEGKKLVFCFGHK